MILSRWKGLGAQKGRSQVETGRRGRRQEAPDGAKEAQRPGHQRYRGGQYVQGRRKRFAFQCAKRYVLVLFFLSHFLFVFFVFSLLVFSFGFARSAVGVGVLFGRTLVRIKSPFKSPTQLRSLLSHLHPPLADYFINANTHSFSFQSSL